MSKLMIKQLEKDVNNLEAAGLLKYETSVTQTETMEVQLDDGSKLLNFFGSDFLSWRSNQKITTAAENAFQTYGTGTTDSRIGLGTMEVLKRLEQRLSLFLNVDDCLVYSSGYLANIGVLAPITTHRDSIFIDELSNPSLIDAAHLSNAKVIAYKHQDMEHLEYHLKCSQSARYRIIVTDGVFHGNGNTANLPHIQTLKTTYDAISIVDDRLGVGLLGSRGSGTLAHLGIEEKSELITGSFAFALGNVGGGFVCGNSTLINWLRQTSRSYIMASPLSAINAAVVKASIDLLESHESAIDALQKNITLAKKELLFNHWPLIDNEHPMLSIPLKSPVAVQKVVAELFQQNILVSGLSYPTTEEGQSVLRINLTANHSEDQIKQLVSAMEKAKQWLE